MTELLGIARFTFHAGMVEEFKHLAEQCLEIVHTQDTGTLQYDVYFNDDESEAIVIERYKDSDALVQHLAHIGDDLMRAIMTTASVQGETLGRPSAELRSQLDGAPVRLFTPYLSLEDTLLRKAEGMTDSSAPLPATVGRPATRALEAAGYRTITDLDGASERELLDLHGIGPRAIRVLREHGVELVP